MCDRCREVLDDTTPESPDLEHEREPPTLSFELQYFKPNGKWEYGGFLDIEKAQVVNTRGTVLMHRVADVIKEHVKDADLPGLAEGVQWEGWIHTEHEDGHPILVDTTEVLD